MREPRFKNRRGVVSGGGRRGGSSQAIVRLLAGEGAKVVLVDLDAAVVEFARELRASKNVQESGGDVEATVGDLADPNVARRAVMLCLERFGRIDFVVNTAGGSDPSVPTTCRASKSKHYRLLYDKNVESARNLIAAAVPPMMDGGGCGDIINFSTTNGTPGWPWAGGSTWGQILNNE